MWHGLLFYLAGSVRNMDRITARADNDFNVILYGTLWIAALSFIWLTCRADPEEAVKYVVETLEQAKPGWKGEVLQEPGLKVHLEQLRVEDYN
jgi:hypothetical protein